MLKNGLFIPNVDINAYIFSACRIMEIAAVRCDKCSTKCIVAKTQIHSHCQESHLLSIRVPEHESKLPHSQRVVYITLTKGNMVDKTVERQNIITHEIMKRQVNFLFSKSF